MYAYEWVANPDRLRPFADDLRNLIFMVTRQTAFMNDPFNDYPIATACRQSHVLCAFHQGKLRERIVGMVVLAPMHQLTTSAGVITDFAVAKGNPGVSTGLMQHVIAKARRLDIRTLLFLDRTERQSELRTFLCKELTFVSGPHFLQYDLSQ